MKYPFLQSQNDILKQLTTEAIYNFLNYYDIEVAKSTASKSQVESSQPTSSIAPEIPIVESKSTDLPVVSEPKSLMSSSGQYRNFSSITLPLLQSNVLNVVQQKTMQLKSSGSVSSLESNGDNHKSTTTTTSVLPRTTNSFDRIVPKLNRSSSMLSQPLDRTQSIASTGKRSIDNVNQPEIQVEKKQKELQVLAEEKIVEPPKEPVKKTNSALQALADIRKGLALKKKPTSGSSVGEVLKDVVTPVVEPVVEPIVVQKQVVEEQKILEKPVLAQKAVPIESGPVVQETVTAVAINPEPVAEVVPIVEPIVEAVPIVEPVATEAHEAPKPTTSNALPVPAEFLQFTQDEPSEKTMSHGTVSDDDEDDLQREELPVGMDNTDSLREESPELDIAPPVITTTTVPSNVYKGNQTSFLTKEPKPSHSFLNGAVEKPKPQIKALEQAALAAKREQEEREKRQKLKDAKEERARQVLERKKELEKQKAQAVQQKLEKRPLEHHDAPKKKPMVPVAPVSKPMISKPVSTFPKPVVKPKLPVPSKPTGLPRKVLEPSESILNSLQPQLKLKVKTTHHTSIVDGNGEIMGINDSDSDSSDDEQASKKPPVPKWAQSPNIRQQLEQQQNIDPDSIFSDLISPNLKEIMGVNKRQSMHQMELTEHEVLEYKKNMGFNKQ